MRGEREENSPMEYTITPLTPHTDAEVRGIDLNEGVDTETRAVHETVEIGGHHASAPVGGRLGAARTVRRDQHIRQFVERTARGPPLRLGLGRVLPPDIEAQRRRDDQPALA